MVLVGNGFDIQALGDIGVRGDTRYTSFFYFLKAGNFNSENLIYAQMSALEAAGAMNWSDVEGAIDRLYRDGVSVAEISSAMNEIQAEFSRFLDGLANPTALAQLNDQTVEHRMTLISLMEFLGDIDDPNEYRKMSLPARSDIGDIYNFLFVNFNYTSLLDNYIYLDKNQFTPHPFKHSDRQVEFHPNPRGYEVTLQGPRTKSERANFGAVSYLTVDVIHPHGAQPTPRSLLFGIDADEESGRDLSKPYWAQNRLKYADLFTETNVFIIFGTSLGNTDRWWWRAMLATLEQPEDDRPDILIYWFNHTGQETPEGVRKRLLEATGLAVTDDLRNALNEHVRVIIYDSDKPRAFLNTNPNLIPSWILPRHKVNP